MGRREGDWGPRHSRPQPSGHLQRGAEGPQQSWGDSDALLDDVGGRASGEMRNNGAQDRQLVDDADAVGGRNSHRYTERALLDDAEMHQGDMPHWHRDDEQVQGEIPPSALGRKSWERGDNGGMEQARAPSLGQGGARLAE